MVAPDPSGHPAAFTNIAPVRSKVWFVPLMVVSLLAPSAAGAGEVEDAVAATSHTAAQYAATFDLADLPGLAELGPPPVITGNATLDARIRAIAEARGYRRRAEPDRPLVAVGSSLLQPEAAAGWETLRVAASAAGHNISVISGYRRVTTQAGFLRARIGNGSDASIGRALRTVAAPGYSKHHTGYAIDVRSSTAEGFDFRNSSAYAWLAADDFANAKAHGWIPSYPEGSTQGGPVPEPWEFVWVGATNIICGDYQVTAARPFCDTLGSNFVSSIEWLVAEGITKGCRADRFCPTGLLTRGQAATFLWRMVGSPTPGTDAINFVDVSDDAYYTAAVRWMVDNELTAGTSSTEFSPNRPATRAEFITFLWRLAGRPDPSGPSPFDDVEPAGFAAVAIPWAAESGITRGTGPRLFSPTAVTSRGEASAFLHRFSSVANPASVG